MFDLYSKTQNISKTQRQKKYQELAERVKKLEKRICLKILLETAQIERKTDLARMKIPLCKINNNIAIFCYYSPKKKNKDKIIGFAI